MASADIDLDANELKSRAERRVGSLLRDKWRLEALLGLGGMAAVYSATHRNGKRGAVKILHAEAAMVPDIRARFLREGYLANKVEHPGAVSILDDDVDTDGTVFLVMELLDGQTLEAAREAGPVSCSELLTVAQRVLEVLAVAHDKSVVHRDLKPANVFICKDGTVKILDFGIARLYDVQASSGRTARDTALGTPGYMPPEQARGRWDEVDGQSDLWALGASLFAILGGRTVHQAATLNEHLLAAMTVPAPPLRSVAPDAPVEVAALVDRALRFHKAERWPDARAMQSEVERVHQLFAGRPSPAGAPSSVSAPSHPVPDGPTFAATQQPIQSAGAPPVRRVSPLLAVGVGLAAAVLLGVLFFLLRSGATTNPTSSSASAAPAAPFTTVAAAATASPPLPGTTPSASSMPTASASAIAPPTEPRAGARKSVVKDAPGAGSSDDGSPALRQETDPFGRRK